jgi:hypothetical protein
VTQGGNVLLYAFEAPEFVGQVPTDDYVVVGSGSPVAEYLAAHMAALDRLPQSDLKLRVDKLLPGLEEALRRINEATVGGMLQIILAEPRGIRPYKYWQVDLDPDRPPEARRMEMTAGRWTQVDLASNQAVPLVEPRRLIRDGAVPVRFQEYAPVPPERQIPKWHLAYLLVCARAELGPGFARFGGVMTLVVAEHYPKPVKCLLALGIWGTAGEHALRVVLELPATEVAVVDAVVSLEYFPEPHDFVFELTAEVPSAGPAFVTCFLDGQRIGRQALFFAELEFRSLAPERIAVECERQQCEWIDAGLEARGGAEVVYFSLCQGCQFQGASLVFEREFIAVYSREYPVIVRACAALGLRLSVGVHTVRLEVVSAASGATHVVTDTKVVSSSSVHVSRLHGDVPLRLSEIGPYFVNVRVDGQRVTSAFLHADDPDSPVSYKLRPVDVPKPGEVLVLLKRSIEAPATSASE